MKNYQLREDFTSDYRIQRRKRNSIWLMSIIVDDWGRRKYLCPRSRRKYIYILAVETRGILNRITGLSGTTDDFRPLIEELGDCRVTGVHSKGPLSIDKRDKGWRRYVRNSQISLMKNCTTRLNISLILILELVIDSSIWVLSLGAVIILTNWLVRFKSACHQVSRD